jgi:hypothetical protein
LPFLIHIQIADSPLEAAPLQSAMWLYLTQRQNCQRRRFAMRREDRQPDIPGYASWAAARLDWTGNAYISGTVDGIAEK